MRSKNNVMIDDDDDEYQNIITIQDLCSGHGLTGLLFLACNPPGKLSKTTIVRTILCDRIEPQSHSILKDYISEICPWVAEVGAVSFDASPLEDFTARATSHDSSVIVHGNHATIVVSTHACGSLTDKVLQYAMHVQAASLAVMPCCYTGTDVGAPYGVRRMLGVGLSADVRRCFYLQENEYHADFTAIPQAITTMNRIIVAERRR